MSIVANANAHSTYIHKMYATHSKQSAQTQSFGQLSGFSNNYVKSDDSGKSSENSGPIYINPACLYKIEQRIFLRQQRHMEQLREAYEMFMPGANPPESFAELTNFHHTLMSFVTGTVTPAGLGVGTDVGVVGFRGNPWDGFKHFEEEVFFWAIRLATYDKLFSSDSTKHLINEQALDSSWTEKEFEFLYAFANNANQHRREIVEANFRIAIETLATSEAKHAVKLIPSGEYVSQETFNNLVDSFKNVMLQLIEQTKQHLVERDYDLLCEKVRSALEIDYRRDGLVYRISRGLELGITIGGLTFRTWAEYEATRWTRLEQFDGLSWNKPLTEQ